MKIWVSILLCVLYTNAFGSVADSGRCPWKMPFTIRIQATGITSSAYRESQPRSGESDTDPSSLDTQYYEVVVDTTFFRLLDTASLKVRTQFSLTADTLRFGYSYSDTKDTAHSLLLLIAFVHGKDSISSIAFKRVDSWNNVPGNSFWADSGSTEVDFRIAALSFTDDSISSSDSSVSQLRFNIVSSSFGYVPTYSMYQSLFTRSFVGSNVKLSGVFRPCFLIKDSTLHALPWSDSIRFIAEGDGIKKWPWGDTVARDGITFFCRPCYMDGNAIHFYSSESSYADWTSTVANRDRSESINIGFIPGTDSVASISYKYKSSESDWEGLMSNLRKTLVFDNTYSFRIADLEYDSSGVFTSDSSFCEHSISIGVTEAHSLAGGTYYTYFSASSADLSGGFQPKHYACDASVPTLKTVTNSLVLATLKDGLHCSFAPSDHSRTIEVYSILGIEDANNEISVGATEATVPHLAAGFYFVRLEDEIAKVIIQ